MRLKYNETRQRREPKVWTIGEVCYCRIGGHRGAIHAIEMPPYVSVKWDKDKIGLPITIRKGGELMTEEQFKAR